MRRSLCLKVSLIITAFLLCGFAESAQAQGCVGWRPGAVIRNMRAASLMRRTARVGFRGAYGSAGSYGMVRSFGSAGSYGAVQSFGSAGSYGFYSSSSSYGSAGSYGSTGGYGQVITYGSTGTAPSVYMGSGCPCGPNCPCGADCPCNNASQIAVPPVETSLPDTTQNSTPISNMSAASKEAAIVRSLGRKVAKHSPLQQSIDHDVMLVAYRPQKNS